MANVIKCDRCGKETKHDAYEFIFNDFCVRKTQFGIRRKQTREYLTKYDICDDCLDDFKSWMSRGPYSPTMCEMKDAQDE